MRGKRPKRSNGERLDEGFGDEMGGEGQGDGSNIQHARKILKLRVNPDAEEHEEDMKTTSNTNIGRIKLRIDKSKHPEEKRVKNTIKLRKDLVDGLRWARDMQQDGESTTTQQDEKSRDDSENGDETVPESDNIDNVMNGVGKIGEVEETPEERSDSEKETREAEEKSREEQREEEIEAEEEQEKQAEEEEEREEEQEKQAQEEDGRENEKEKDDSSEKQHKEVREESVLGTSKEIIDTVKRNVEINTRSNTQDIRSEVVHPRGAYGEGEGGFQGYSENGKSKKEKEALSSLFESIYYADIKSAAQSIRMAQRTKLDLNGYGPIVLERENRAVRKNEEEVEEVNKVSKPKNPYLPIDTRGHVWTPLHAAAFFGRAKIIGLLLDTESVNPELRDSMMGGTALIWAAYGGHPNGLRRLLFEGNADVKVVNNLGQAPIDVVPNPENSKWKELLSADSRPTPRKRGGPKNTTRSSRTANMQAEEMAPTQTQTQTQAQMQIQMQTQSYTEVQPQAQQAELQSQVVTTQLPDEVRWGELSDKERAAVVSKGFPDIHAIVGCLEAVLQYKNEEDEEIAEVFEDLPDQEEYPEYYQIFKKPISLGVIANKVVQGQYTGFGQFDADMLTVFNNACFFNTHGSEIYSNSVTLMGVYFTARKTLVEKYGIKFDLALAEAKPAKGRYVTRIMNGELDIGVGDCVEAVSEDGTKRVAIVLRLSVSGPRDRVQHMDGMWFRHPKDTAMSQHNLAYPHELVLDTTLFTGHPVKFVQKRVAVLPLSAYIHYYPAGFEKSELYVCEYALTSNSVLAQLSSWPTPSPMPQPAEHRLNLVPQPPLKLVRLPLELWAITTSAAIASRITMLAPQSVGIAPSTTGAAFSQRKPLTQAVHNVTTMQPVAVGNSSRPSSLPTTRAAMLMKHQQQQAQQQAQQQTTPQLHQTAGSYLQPHQPSAQLYANTGQSVVTHVSAFPHARPHPHTNLVKPDSFPGQVQGQTHISVTSQQQQQQQQQQQKPVSVPPVVIDPHALAVLSKFMTQKLTFDNSFLSYPGISCIQISSPDLIKSSATNFDLSSQQFWNIAKSKLTSHSIQVPINLSTLFLRPIFPLFSNPSNGSNSVDIDSSNANTKSNSAKFLFCTLNLSPTKPVEVPSPANSSFLPSSFTKVTMDNGGDSKDSDSIEWCDNLVYVLPLLPGLNCVKIELSPPGSWASLFSSSDLSSMSYTIFITRV